MKLLVSLIAVAIAVPCASALVREPVDEQLERALEAIQARNIRADLGFIASDELAGRDTPSEGQRVAARFIRARLARLGFQPGGGDGRFLHTYQLEKVRLDLAGTGARIEVEGEKRELVFGADYYFHPRGIDDLAVSGGVVFAGDGRKETVQALDLAGKWALVVDTEGVTWRQRQRNVLARGAHGVLVMTEGEDRFGKQAPRIKRWIENGNLTVGRREPTVPHVYLPKASADLLWKKSPGERRIGSELDAMFSDRRKRSADSVRHELENVAGFWPGADPRLSKEVIILSAHYDHVGQRNGEIYNGADDNGSGTCGLLALAEALHAHGPMRRSVLLLWVSGEEKGLLGSEVWSKEPTLPEGYSPVANLNIDMIGRNAPDSLLITPTKAHEAYNFLTQMAEQMAALEGFGELGSCDDYWSRSDHKSFSVNMGIPVAFLFADIHEDYHEPTDTVEKIDFDKIRRVSRLVMRMLGGLQGDSLDL